MNINDAPWIPPTCTLPTVEQPLRLAEFDDLLATALLHQQRISGTRLQWSFDPAAQEKARSLTARENLCCSYFTFSFAINGDHLQLEVKVPTEQAAVLDALAERAAAWIRA